MKFGRLFTLCAVSAALSLPGLAQYQAGKAPAKPDATAEEPEPVIPGMTIERKTGDGLLGIEIADNNFKLTFYGKDKKPVQADRPRALLRWPVTYKSVDERVILSRGGNGTFLTSPRIIRPPHHFRLYITLLGNEGEAEETDPVTYVVNFRG